MAQQPFKKTKEAAEDTVNDAAELAEVSYEELKEQIEILKADIAELSAAALRAGEQTAREKVARARSTGRKAVNQASAQIDHAAEQFETVLSDAEVFARERPGVALGLAAGAGFLLAMAMSRR